MKLTIKSNGTMQGTSVKFKMTANEIPEMIARAQRRNRVLRNKQPPDVVVASDLQGQATDADCVLVTTMN